VLSVQVEEGGSDGKTGEKETGKNQILEEVCQAKQKANNDPTYSTTLSFNWADDVDASIIPIGIMHHKPAPTTNVNASVNPFPAAHAHVPRDLSVLCSGVANPWATLRRHHRSQKPHHPVRQKHHSFKYPANISIHTPFKPKPSPPLGVFETIRHPHGIRPTKLVIRVPARMAMDTSANLAPPMHHTIVKSAPPSLPLQSTVAVRCQCGQLVRVSDGLQIRNIPLHHTLRTFISNFVSPFCFPSLFFSRFTFS